MSYIDTRDLVKELEDLEEQDGGYKDELELAVEEDAETPIDPLDEDERERMEALRELIEDLSSNSGDTPNDGITLIPEDEFTEYAQEFAEDIGAIASDAPWPVYCIDWEKAARDLQMDYTSVDFDGVTYYYR